MREELKEANKKLQEEITNNKIKESIIYWNETIKYLHKCNEYKMERNTETGRLIIKGKKSLELLKSGKNLYFKELDKTYTKYFYNHKTKKIYYKHILSDYDDKITNDIFELLDLTHHNEAWFTEQEFEINGV